MIAARFPATIGLSTLRPCLAPAIGRLLGAIGRFFGIMRSESSLKNIVGIQKVKEVKEVKEFVSWASKSEEYIENH